MSDSLQPHRWQPTRLPSPWDSPGKNTGVGCHFLLQCMKVKSESEVAQSCPTLRPHGLQPTRLLHPWDFPGKSTGVGCYCFLCNEADVEVFLEFSYFFYDPTDVGKLIYGSSAYSKSILYIWKFSVQASLKPSLKDFQHYFVSM